MSEGAGSDDLLTVSPSEVDGGFYKFRTYAFAAEFLIHLSVIYVYRARAGVEIVEFGVAFAFLFDKKGPFPALLFVFYPHFYQTK